MDKLPINDTIIYALARLVDDAQKERRDPSHSDIEFQIERAGLSDGDPNKDGPPVGKSKRVRTVLSWALDKNYEGAELFTAGLLSSVRACGGFRETSPNFVGKEAIADLSNAFKSEGVLLSKDGELLPVSLENLSGQALTEALEAYVKRAKKGIEDAALLVGTSKDLMEAVAAHVLHELYGSYPTTVNFPTLLGQAFTELEMATTEDEEQQGEHPRRKLERSMYAMAISINRLRNKQGTGHGRPWIPDLRDYEAKAAIEFIGILSETLINKLKSRKKIQK